jgi:predicted nucleotidyltransferase component of viral defense system
VKKDKDLTRNKERTRLDEVKRLVVIAMFSDDELMERLVLKGGNALDLIHHISTRASVDVDFSMAGDFPKQELQAYKLRVERALVTTFRPAGYEVFDVTMEEKPQAVSADLADFWGGYAIEFKAIEKTQYNKFANDIEQLRRNAMMLGQGSKFLIDISRFEYTQGKQRRDFGGYTIFVYSPAMMICEKLRAICQQTQEYRPVIKRLRAGSPRARDFLDIYSLVTECNIDMTVRENCELLQHIFDAKKVPLNFLRFVSESRDFHRANWAAVRDSIKAGIEVKDYEFYFDFVVTLVERLKPFWDM